MNKLAIALAAFAAIGIAMPVTSSPARAEEAKVVIGVDRDHDRDHDREMRRHHKKIVVTEHRRHHEYGQDHD